MNCRAWLAIGLVGVAGCDRGKPAPPYVRMTGAAPPLGEVPATRATLLVFWASWCAPCVAETPSLKALAQQPPEQLSVVVFAHQDTAEGVARFFGGKPPPALNLRFDDAVGEALGVDVLPVTVLAVDGQLVARFSGQQDWDARPMRALLERLIAR